MHLAALAIGIILILVCGSVLKVVLFARAKENRKLESFGINDRLPVRPEAVIFLTSHTVGVLGGIFLTIWGWRGM